MQKPKSEGNIVHQGASSSSAKRSRGKLLKVLYTQIVMAIVVCTSFNYRSARDSIKNENESAATGPYMENPQYSRSLEAQLQEQISPVQLMASQQEKAEHINRYLEKRRNKAPLKIEKHVLLKNGKSISQVQVANSQARPSNHTKLADKLAQKAEGFKGKKLHGRKKEKAPIDDLLVQPNDFIYQKLPGESAPIVLEQYKLIFFAQAKVGCTIWKMLFRRMEGYEDWKSHTRGMPHVPERNGLKYLYGFNRTYASEIMTSNNWTRAIFLRDPKERFLSAYLDKAVEESLFLDTCCNTQRQIHCNPTPPSMEEFLTAIHRCRDSHWDPQSRRMEAKYWPYINFVGHLETAQEDAQRLLKKIHVWEHFGLSGWGENETLPIFGSSDGLKHSNDAKSKVNQYIYPELQQKVEEWYKDDYDNPLFGYNKSKIEFDSDKPSQLPFVEPRDWIYRKAKRQGEAAPVVIEKHKLVFFLVPGAGEVHFKRLLLRMSGQEDWKTRNYTAVDHDGFTKGLKYLRDYSLEEASEMMTSKDWTRALFIRDPKERFVEAYRKMAIINRRLLHDTCCMVMPRMFCLKSGRPKALLADRPNVTNFLDGIKTCKNTHWDPMTERLTALRRLGLIRPQQVGYNLSYHSGSKYWRYIDFIGSMDNAGEDAKALLERIGVYQDYGESGWGDDMTQSFLLSKDFFHEELLIQQHLHDFIVDRAIETQLEEFYERDYTHFKLTKRKLHSVVGKTYAAKRKELEDMMKV